MGFATAALICLGAMQVGTSIASGYAQSREAKYNAALLEQTLPLYDVQTGLVEKQKQLELYQANRQIGQVMGTTRAMTAGKGLTLSGSPMAIMLDIYTQMEIDKRIGQSNLELQKYGIQVEKGRVSSQAAAYRRQAKTAIFSGYTNAFTAALQTGVSYGIYKGAFTPKTYTANISGMGNVRVAPPNYYLKPGRL